MGSVPQGMLRSLLWVGLTVPSSPQVSMTEMKSYSQAVTGVSTTRRYVLAHSWCFPLSSPALPCSSLPAC